MLRGIASITALVFVGALAGCSSADQGHEPASVGAQAESLAAQCHHGGEPRTVSLLSFDPGSMELVGITSDGAYVDTWLTSSTTPVAANIRLFPPDPIFPQCRDDATAWNQALGDGLTSGVLGDLAQLAADGCDVSVVVAFDGTIASVQPVP